MKVTGRRRRRAAAARPESSRPATRAMRCEVITRPCRATRFDLRFRELVELAVRVGRDHDRAHLVAESSDRLPQAFAPASSRSAKGSSRQHEGDPFVSTRASAARRARRESLSTGDHIFADAHARAPRRSRACHAAEAHKKLKFSRAVSPRKQHRPVAIKRTSPDAGDRRGQRHRR